MPVYKKNGKYYARINYTTADGKHKSKQSKYFDLKREAELEETKLIQEYKIDKKVLSAKQYTIKEVYDLMRDYKLNNNFAVGTLSRNDAYIKGLSKFHNLIVGKITQSDANEIKKYIKDNYKQSTYAGYFGFINQLFKFAKKNLKQNLQPFELKCPKITQPTRRLNYYTEDEFNKFIKCVDTDNYKALFTLLFYNGLRMSEARGLTFDDFDGSHIIIDKQYGRQQLTKILKNSHSYRTLPVNKNVANLIQQQKEYYSQFYGFDNSWYIFGGLKPSSEKAIHNHYDLAKTKAKLKKITIHEFRHSCASHYIHLGYPIHLVAKLLGDNIDTVTKTYFHLYNQDLENMINAK